MTPQRSINAPLLVLSRWYLQSHIGTKKVLGCLLSQTQAARPCRIHQLWTQEQEDDLTATFDAKGLSATSGVPNGRDWDQAVLGVQVELDVEAMRQILGDGVDAIVITPALFSSGWQVNPSFCQPTTTKVRADRTEFLARQFGGVFAKGIIEGWLGWKCPFLDLDLVDGKDKNDTLIPSGRRDDHPFDLDPRNDDWGTVAGQAAGPLSPMEVLGPTRPRIPREMCLAAPNHHR
ncbi:hypothetical protein F5Y04DRAFT_285840 [Hypomontagnella monticulosa]|nr:hypothetical protein F5Y04DRAFT_285840 [Hypomontagnella monticulosa]